MKRLIKKANLNSLAADIASVLKVNSSPTKEDAQRIVDKYIKNLDESFKNTLLSNPFQAARILITQVIDALKKIGIVKNAKLNKRANPMNSLVQSIQDNPVMNFFKGMKEISDSINSSSGIIDLFHNLTNLSPNAMNAIEKSTILFVAMIVVLLIAGLRSALSDSAQHYSFMNDDYRRYR